MGFANRDEEPKTADNDEVVDKEYALPEKPEVEEEATTPEKVATPLSRVVIGHGAEVAHGKSKDRNYSFEELTNIGSVCVECGHFDERPGLPWCPLCRGPVVEGTMVNAREINDENRKSRGL